MADALDIGQAMDIAGMEEKHEQQDRDLGIALGLDDARQREQQRRTDAALARALQPTPGTKTRTQPPDPAPDPPQPPEPPISPADRGPMPGGQGAFLRQQAEEIRLGRIDPTQGTPLGRYGPRVRRELPGATPQVAGQRALETPAPLVGPELPPTIAYKLPTPAHGQRTPAPRTPLPGDLPATVAFERHEPPPPLPPTPAPTPADRGPMPGEQGLFLARQAQEIRRGALDPMLGTRSGARGPQVRHELSGATPRSLDIRPRGGGRTQPSPMLPQALRFTPQAARSGSAQMLEALAGIERTKDDAPMRDVINLTPPTRPLSPIAEGHHELAMPRRRYEPQGPITPFRFHGTPIAATPVEGVEISPTASIQTEFHRAEEDPVREATPERVSHGYTEEHAQQADSRPCCEYSRNGLRN